MDPFGKSGLVNPNKYLLRRFCDPANRLGLLNRLVAAALEGLLPVSYARSIMAEQTVKAFLKQPKKSGKGKRPGKGGNRFWKSIGLGFKTPETPLKKNRTLRHVLAGTYIGKKCPFTGNVYEKRHSNIPAHIPPCFRVKEGDHVIIGQCRPLAKTVRFNVLKVISAGSTSGGSKKAFAAVPVVIMISALHMCNLETLYSLYEH
ncbi:hypothetical protein C4D60_Mb09t08240 [Musa balbisiana]|uniref:Uncharacterized protein n=1 Tax=Musa balbisiana TaxID=52838 RepID=A0A4V4H337_MUSBA|nr:hypothetical protein C4D60_Mb09t08240 [Musa balbisiana]